MANCSVTEYSFDASGPRLIRYNYTVPVEDEAVPVTDAADPPAGVRG